jgi:hypothetical protein
MAQQLDTENGIAFLAGAYPSITVQKNNANLAATGVIALIGEADAGPDAGLESDLSQNFFTPDNVAAVIAKYKSGPLVEAFRAASAPAKDPDISGAPAAIYLVKTNVSTKASGVFARAGFSNYGTLADQNYGDLGNLINATVTAAATEVAPTTGSFTYIPTPSGATLAVRVNGGAKQTASISAKLAPSALVGSVVSGSATGLNGLSGVLATGGVNRGVLTGLTGATLAVSTVGNTITVTLGGTPGAWAATPVVGDTLVIPNSGDYGAAALSSIAGSNGAGAGTAASATGKNLGAYVVTGATATTVTATKLRNATATVLSAPEAVNAVATAAGVTDLVCYSPVAVQNVTGADRAVLTGLVGQTVTGTAAGQSIKLTLATGQVWAALPQAGDYLLINSSAPAAMHASGANGGWYQVTAATSGTTAGASTVTATRLSNGAPGSFVATAVAATTDIQVIRPVIDGLGKSLELFDGSGTDPVATTVYALSTTPASFISASGAAQLLTSAAEYKATVTVGRQTDGVSESVTAGGDVVLRLGYNGTSATVTISGTTLTTTVVGGTGASLSAVNLTKFKTIGSLANFLGSQTGYTCSVANAQFGQLPVVTGSGTTAMSVLGQGTYGICSENGSCPGRIKKDAYAFFTALSQGSTLAQFGIANDPTLLVQAASGLPEVQGTFYLASGARGATTAVGALAAVTQCEKLKVNFVVPLFSQDAAADIALGLTDVNSTYSVDAINAAVSSHIIAMSSFKRRRNRQAVLSKRDTFKNVKLAAANIANYRCTMVFQDTKLLALDGTIRQFQPWMTAVLAAASQAAAFYKSILFKGINCSGVLQWDGSFDANLDPHLEDAVKAGLLVAQRVDTGGFRWNSDQTTYGVDGNFVFNSMQAIYAADIVAITTATRMEKAFVGQSLADVSASVALSYLKGIMADLKRLKLIAGDDEAPLGFSDAKIQISGNTMKVTAMVKLATTIVFIPISFLVSQVQSTAQ